MGSAATNAFASQPTLRGAKASVASWVVLGVLFVSSTADAPTPSGSLLAANETAIAAAAASSTTVAPGASTPNVISTTVPSTASTAATTTEVPDDIAASAIDDAAPVARRAATLTFTGDVLIHSRVWQTARTLAATGPNDYDFTPLLEPIQPWLDRADVNVCHLEVNLSADNQGLSSFPRFRAPGALAESLAFSGFDRCSTASNHSLDQGYAGLNETLSVLDDAGITTTGTARTPEEAAQNRWIEVSGFRIAHLSYSYWFNGLLLPDDAPWAANEIDEAKILADAAQARSDGADVVILSMHWGEQYQSSPNQQQADLGPRLLASDDIDLIVGHHAHVVQRIDRIDGEWLVFGLGNLLANYDQAERRDQLLVEITIEEQPDGSVEVTDLAALPLHVDPATLAVVPAGPSARPPDLTLALSSALDASWARTVEILQQGSGFDELVLLGR